MVAILLLVSYLGSRVSPASLGLPVRLSQAQSGVGARRERSDLTDRAMIKGTTVSWVLTTCQTLCQALDLHHLYSGMFCPFHR